MKKLFHLGLIALFVISVSSCSKSADDLLDQNETQSGNTAASTAKTGISSRSHIPLILTVENEATVDIHKFINEPSPMELAIPEVSVIIGEQAVFFVEVSSTIMSQQILSAKLSITTDQMAWSEPRGYDLISHEEAAAYGIKPPETLGDKLYMFAIVNLHDLDSFPTDMFSLYSFIITDQMVAKDKMYNAFQYKP